MADITPSKPRTSASRLSDSVSHLCGKQCSVKSCECVKSMIFSPGCYLEKYKYGLQVKPSNHDEASHSVFGIYFVICVIFTVFMIMFYAVYRATMQVCGGKRNGIVVIT